MTEIRAYLATSMAGLHALHTTGVLPAGTYEAFVPVSSDEEDEYDTMHVAGETAFERFGDHVVVAADIADDTSDVPASAIASIHVGPDLAWFATQELRELLS